MDLQGAADAIWEAAERGVYYPAEWRGRLSLVDAYRVNLLILARRVGRGERQAGWKVGLTAKAMQLQQGVHEPVFGVLLESGHRPSGHAFRFDELIQPGFENELCLTIGRPLQGPGVTAEAARAVVVAVAPALEVVERRGDFAADLPLAMADNAQQKAFVTGPPRALPPGFALADTTVEVLVNGVSADRATGAAVMGDPVHAVAWLANKLAELGLRIEAEQRIMSGSLTRQYPVSRGDRVEARFAPFGPVSAAFL